MTGSPVVAIGADAADANLVRKWAGEGHLPTFARLLQTSLVAPIATPVGVLEGGIWPTMLTSSSPAVHGMFAFQALKPGTYDIENGMRADRLPAPPFWAHMSEGGRRVAVVDAPFARPVEGLNGVHVTNWGVHDSWSWPRSSWPAGMIDELVRRFGEHPVHHCDAENRSPADYEGLRARLLAGVERKTELLRHVLGLEDWNFFFGVFSESHCAGHQFWHFMDPTHPRHPASPPDTLRWAIRDVYQAIDRGLGCLLAGLGADARVVVILSHGMGPYYTGAHLLEHVLDRLGYAGSADASGFPERDSYAIGGLGSVTWNLRRVLPRGLRDALKARWRGHLDALWGLTHPVPTLWKRGMRAFVIPSNNMTSAIRINVQGREPYGAVAAGAEYEATCDDLAARLLELENPDTGRPAVQWVKRAREIYQGPRLRDLPDLFVEWDHATPVTVLRSPRIGTIQGFMAAERTGDHWKQGLLLARGPGLRQGLVGSLRTEDVGPTLLDLLGIPRPAGYEGQSVLPMLRSPVRSSSARVMG
jgi:predicted AlkP superfamily phosphohydrolase/phosphomutase